jgi:beta-phosphoglucomutase
MSRAVIFDMDGVLVDTARPHYESWLAVARERGVALTYEQFHETFGQPNHQIIPRLFGPGLSDEEVRRIDEQKEAAFRDIFRHEVEPLPGVVELIGALQRAGWLLAVGSSAPPENIELVLEALGVAESFSAVVCAKDVQRGKPAPDVFLKAAEALGVQPARCLVIEDAPAGIQAAHAAGMACLALTSSHPAGSLKHADRIVASLEEFTPADAAAMLDRHSKARPRR